VARSNHIDQTSSDLSALDMAFSRANASMDRYQHPYCFVC
jgi:hypothetical protein